MDRKLTITAAEWASSTDGTLWIVGEGEPWTSGGNYMVTTGQFSPPAEFVAACAPCETCDDTRNLRLFPRHVDPCPDCRIELVGPCLNLAHCQNGEDDCWCTYETVNTVTLGYGYPVGQPLPIISQERWDQPNPTLPTLVVAYNSGWTVVQVPMNGPYVDTTDRLAHYGPLETLVGKWAMRVVVDRG